MEVRVGPSVASFAAAMRDTNSAKDPTLSRLHSVVGALLGLTLGVALGSSDGLSEGMVLGDTEGKSLGIMEMVGDADGDTLGTSLGTSLGPALGTLDGMGDMDGASEVITHIHLASSAVSALPLARMLRRVSSSPAPSRNLTMASRRL